VFLVTIRAESAPPPATPFRKILREPLDFGSNLNHLERRSDKS